MPEIDLSSYERNSKFESWKRAKFLSGKGADVGFIDSVTDGRTQFSIIDSEVLLTCTPYDRTWPDTAIISENHLKDLLKEAGVIFDAKPTIKDVLGKAIEQTEQDIERIQTEGRPSDLIY